MLSSSNSQNMPCHWVWRWRIRVCFFNKAQQQKSGVAQDDSGSAGHMSEYELKNFKAQLKGEQSKSQSSQSEEEDEEESLKPAALLCGFNEENEDCQKDLDLLTVKHKDVFNINEESQDDDEDTDAKAKNKKQKESKFTDAKKMQENFKANTKKIFTEDGEEKRLKENAARREVNKQHKECQNAGSGRTPQTVPGLRSFLRAQQSQSGGGADQSGKAGCDRPKV